MPRSQAELRGGFDRAALAEGRALFSKLALTEQLRLAHEVVASRGAELRRAYPDILSLGFGLKTKRGPRGARENLTRTPCVVFEVRRKLALEKRGRARRLPKELLTFVGPPEARRLCVVPTDVKETRSFGQPRPKAKAGHARGFGIAVTLGDQLQDAASGALACPVRMPDGSLAAIGCRHVLSRSLLHHPDVVANARVSATVGPRVALGRTVAIRGRFASAPELSFDAQLVRVTDAAALDAACGPLQFSGHLRSPEELPLRFFVPTPRLDGPGQRTIVEVEFRDWMQERPMAYPFPGAATMVAHALVFHGRTNRPLVEGDSGSPAFTSSAGGTLLGMYLGGDGENAYFIPAWQLFQPANYGRSPPAWSIPD